MTINRYRYFYACAFSMFEKHLVAFVDEMVEDDHAESKRILTGARYTAG
jgi:hypothetical protein